MPGKRTNGTGAANFTLVPPGWSGNLPPDVEHLNAPTPYVWISGRTQTNGVKDYDAVHKLQDGYKITLLGKIGKKIDTSLDTKAEPLRLVNGMPATEYFRRPDEPKPAARY